MDLPNARRTPSFFKTINEIINEVTEDSKKEIEFLKAFVNEPANGLTMDDKAYYDRPARKLYYYGKHDGTFHIDEIDWEGQSIPKRTNPKEYGPGDWAE